MALNTWCLMPCGQHFKEVRVMVFNVMGATFQGRLGLWYLMPCGNVAHMALNTITLTSLEMLPHGIKPHNPNLLEMLPTWH
jgi:hypothetical protein